MISLKHLFFVLLLATVSQSVLAQSDDTVQVLEVVGVDAETSTVIIGPPQAQRARFNFGASFESGNIVSNSYDERPTAMRLGVHFIPDGIELDGQATSRYFGLVVNDHFMDILVGYGLVYLALPG